MPHVVDLALVVVLDLRDFVADAADEGKLLHPLIPQSLVARAAPYRRRDKLMCKLTLNAFPSRHASPRGNTSVLGLGQRRIMFYLPIKNNIPLSKRYTKHLINAFRHRPSHGNGIA